MNRQGLIQVTVRRLVEDMAKMKRRESTDLDGEEKKTQ